MIGRTLTLTFWTHNPDLQSSTAPWWWGSLAGLLFGAVFIMIEVAFTKRFLALISTVIFGVVFGFIASFLFTKTLFLLPIFNEGEAWFQEWVQYCSLAVFVYMSVVGILQSRDDFKFVIPFIELKKEEKGPKPLLLDTSVVIDGRIADVMEMHLISSKVILPRFVLQELQQVADSQDKLKRNRGRRGLDVLNRMQNSKGSRLEIYEGSPPSAEGVDGKLVALAKFMDARVVTNDFNLNKIAQLQGVEVVNLNDLAVAMRPVMLPGETLEVKVQKAGDNHGQGVGYLDDGTMVVIEGGYHHIGEIVPLSVTSVIQTSAGRMIFGQMKGQSQVPQAGGGAPPGGEQDGRGPQGGPRHPKPKTDPPPSGHPPGRPKSDSPVSSGRPSRGNRPSDRFRKEELNAARSARAAAPPAALPMPSDSGEFRAAELKGGAEGGLKKGSDAPLSGDAGSGPPGAKEKSGGTAGAR
ncbi:MAG: TRAM domain-containing protein [Planctomycetes bacterium]|nr:TRAM domain-containing protein [Planctomycetota bacterium]